VKPGIPDVCLPIARHPYAGLWIELKVGKGRLAPSQLEWKSLLELHGHKVIVARRLDEATRAICAYLDGEATREPPAE
jgi:hypothetical protein